MERYNFQISEACGANVVDDKYSYINRGDFNSCEVNQGFFNSQDNGTMAEATNSYQTSSFLTPINELLDINVLNNADYCEEGSMPSAMQVQNIGQIDYSWPLEDTAEATYMSSYVNIPEGTRVIHVPTTNGAINNGLQQENSYTQNSILLHNGSANYAGSENCFIGNDCSTYIDNEWVPNYEQQSVVYFNGPLPPIQQRQLTSSDHELHEQPFAKSSNTLLDCQAIAHDNAQECENSSFLDMNESEYYSNTLTEDVQLPNANNVCVQSENYIIEHAEDQNNCEENTNEPTKSKDNVYLHSFHNYLKESNITDAKRNYKSIYTNLDCVTSQRQIKKPIEEGNLKWTAALSPNSFSQPPEMIVMHPIRTRKYAIQRSATPENFKSSEITNISVCKDASSLNAPFLYGRMCSKNNNARKRKQELNELAGSDNYKFEIHKLENSLDKLKSSKTITENMNGEVDPYPETELPELDEIFKRKKKLSYGPNNSNGSQKKNVQIILGQKFFPIEKSSQMFDEKASFSIAIRKRRSIVSIDENADIYNTDSDSEDSDEDKIQANRSAKSFKCVKCNKIFKSSRAKSIHTKLCKVIAPKIATPKERNTKEADASPKLRNIKTSDHNINSHTNNININSKKRTKSNKENQTGCVDDKAKKSVIVQRISGIQLQPSDCKNEIKIRPITRSQTKKSISATTKPSATLKR